MAVNYSAARNSLGASGPRPKAGRINIRSIEEDIRRHVMKLVNKLAQSHLAYVTGFLLAISPHSANSENLAAVEVWQNNILFDPNESILERERSGFVRIYDGITDKEIERAMREQFNRIEAMMFVNVVKTDEAGEVLTDPVTEEPLEYDDGCD